MFRYIILADRPNNIIDTKEMIPHVECYHIKNNNELWAEEICGREYFMGYICGATNSIEDLTKIIK